jgi:hypothetical protein
VAKEREDDPGRSALVAITKLQVVMAHLQQVAEETREMVRIQNSKLTEHIADDFRNFTESRADFNEGIAKLNDSTNRKIHNLELRLTRLQVIVAIMAAAGGAFGNVLMDWLLK